MATIDSVALVQRKYRNVIEKAVKVAPTSFNLVQTMEWEGERIEWRHETALIPSVGFNREGGSYPVAQDPVLVSPFVGRKFLDGSAQATIAAMRAARGGGNSFANLISYLTEGLTKSYIQLRNVAYAGDGSGVLGYILGSSATEAGLTESSTTVTSGHRFIRVGWQLADGTAFPTNTPPRNPINPVRAMWPGAVLDVIDEDTSDNVLGQVTVRNPIGFGSARSAAYFEIGNGSTGGLPSSTAVGDPLVKTGGLGLAYDGLGSLIDDDVTGTFQGVDYTANPTARLLVSTVLTGGGTKRDLSQELLNRLFQGVSERSDGAGTIPGDLKVQGHSAMMHEFNKLYLGEIRITPSDKVAGSSVSAIATPFGNAELKPDNFLAPGTLYFVDTSKLGFVVQQPMMFVPVAQGTSGNWVYSRAASVLEAKIYEIAQMCIYDRTTSGKIEDLNAKVQTGL